MLAILVWTSSALAGEPACQPGQLILKFSPQTGKLDIRERDGKIALGIPSLDEKLARYGAEDIGRVFPHKHTELGNIYRLRFDPQHDVATAAGDFAAEETILYAVPRYIHQLCDLPDDPAYSSGMQWYIDKVNGPQAWDIAHGDSTVIIGIVDTGTDLDHPDLKDNLWLNPGEDVNGDGKITAIDVNNFDDDGNSFIDDFFGWDFEGIVGTPDNYPMESPGSVGPHGTHCAGIAAAVTDNGLGCAGMSWNCTIMTVKVTRDGQNGVLSGYEGIQYAADNGADVISVSWGRSAGIPSPFQQEIIDSAFARGAIIVAAAGNDPGTAPPDSCPLYWPAWYDHVTAVAATDSNDQVPDWSFYGTWVDICAPGVDIYSTYWNDTYGTRMGTSMATPLVAGVAGLLKSTYPDMDGGQFETHVGATADLIDHLNPGYEGWLGGGRINAYRALNETVPVVLTGFQSVGGQGCIELKWSTAAEVNCHRWEIHRAVGEDERYTRIGELPGQGSSDREHSYHWIDQDVVPGTVYGYKLRQVDFDGSEWWSDPVSATATVSRSYALHQNYPNPFNPATEIGYAIPGDEYVTLKVFNIVGAEVAALVAGEQKAGSHTIRWNAGDLASGLYFCRLQAREYVETVKMVLMR
ncbi:S8 family serine peptidase [Candidatus Zixiibacteriota bacterium]